MSKRTRPSSSSIPKNLPDVKSAEELSPDVFLQALVNQEKALEVEVEVEVEVASNNDTASQSQQAAPAQVSTGRGGLGDLLSKEPDPIVQWGCRIPQSLKARIHNFRIWCEDNKKPVTNGDLAAEALMRLMDDVEREYNEGSPFPKRTRSLKVGPRRR